MAVSQSVAVTQDKTRCSVTGTLPERASSGKPFERALMGCEAFGIMKPSPRKEKAMKHRDGNGHREMTLRLPASRWSGARVEWYG